MPESLAGKGIKLIRSTDRIYPQGELNLIIDILYNSFIICITFMDRNSEDSGNRMWSRFLVDAMQNSPEFSGAFNKERQLFHDLASKGELGENVTVMCCGDGREMDLLLDLHEEFPQLRELHGVDLLSLSIDQVREKVRERMKQLDDVRVHLHQEDATNTSILPHSQDTVTCMLTMVNFNDETIAKFLRHVEHILKPGGKFIFSVYNHSAFDARIKLYKKMEAPIESADPESGLVVFGQDFEEAAFSRQFTEEQFRRLAENTGLEMSSYDGEGITHMGVLEKAKVQLNRTYERSPVYQQILATAASIAFFVGAGYLQIKKTEEVLAANKDSKVMEVAPGQFKIVDMKTGRIIH